MARHGPAPDASGPTGTMAGADAADALLEAPLGWAGEEDQAPPAGLRRVLDDLQAGILKFHGRRYGAHLLVTADPGGGAAFVQGLASLRPTSAAEQLVAARRWERGQGNSAPVVTVHLSAAGFDLLGTPAALRPDDPAFGAGMAGRERDSGRRASEGWDEGISGAHGLIIIAGDDLEAVDSRREEVVGSFGSGCAVRTEWGVALRPDPAGPTYEHFGYADGLSGPAFFARDVAPGGRPGGHRVWWNPAVGPLGVVLVPGPGGAGKTGYGSYLVFSKLEQHVRRFEAQLRRLASQLGLSRQEAAGLLVGRSPAGAALARLDVVGDGSYASNRGGYRADPDPGAIDDFTYWVDPDGRRCPLTAHVRTMNPRDGASRRRMPARRGMPYGPPRDPRVPHPDLGTYPEGDVGLLFSAHLADIAAQFEALQAAADGDGGSADQLLGPSRRTVVWPSKDGPAKVELEPCITPRGGEYFYTPSRSHLAAIASAVSRS